MNTKENIITTSLQLFEQYGYENVSIAQIMKQCKISKGGLYHHFKNKEEILDKSIEHLITLDYESKKDKIFKDKNCIDRIINIILIELINNIHVKNYDCIKSDIEVLNKKNSIFVYRAKELSTISSIQIIENILIEGINKSEISIKEPSIIANYIFTISTEYLKDVYIEDENIIYKTELFIDLLSTALKINKENFNKIYSFIKEEVL